jgi:hypothetical protein
VSSVDLFDSLEQTIYDMLSKWAWKLTDGWRRGLEGEGINSYSKINLQDDSTSEKFLLTGQRSVWRLARFSREKLRLYVALFLGSVIVTLIVTIHCYLSLPCDSEAQAAELESIFDSGQVQARASAVLPSPTPSGVLKCFQVYQPVLTPSGPSDDTVSEDGSSNTTTIEPWATTSSCTNLLMEHSFGFSYGHPFVGMCS